MLLTFGVECRGGMGFSHKDRTIGQNPPKYMPDTYQNGRQLGKELRKKARARIPKPFNSSPNQGNGMFNSNPFNNPPGPDAVQSKAKKIALKKPFIPSNPPKKGAAYETISKTGREYTSEPAEEVVKVLHPILRIALLGYVVGKQNCVLCMYQYHNTINTVGHGGIAFAGNLGNRQYNM